MATEHTPYQPKRELKAAGAGNSQLYRELKYQLKQAHKLLGKQGETIYQLRNENAALRARAKSAEGALQFRQTVMFDPEVLEPYTSILDKMLSEHYDEHAPDELPAPSQIEGLA